MNGSPRSRRNSRNRPGALPWIAVCAIIGVAVASPCAAAVIADRGTAAELLAADPKDTHSAQGRPSGARTVHTSPIVVSPGQAPQTQASDAASPMAPETEQLRPELLESLRESPPDGLVPVTVEWTQEIGEVLRAETWWDDANERVSLGAAGHTFRLSPDRHIFHFRCRMNPQQTSADLALDLAEAHPHTIRVQASPRFTGPDLLVQVWRGKWKVFEKRFSAPPS